MFGPWFDRAVIIAAERAIVDPLGFKKHDGVIVFDRGNQQPLGIIRGRGNNCLDPADMREQAFGALAMRLPAEYAAAKGRTHGHGANEVIGGTIAHARGLTDQLIETGVDVIRKLNLGHGTQAIGCHADSNANDATFADGRIKNTGFAMLFLKPRSRAEHAAEIADVFPHDDNVGVFRQHHVERAIDCLNHVHGFGRGLRHQRAFHSGPNLSRCSSNICSHCSFKCHGISSNTSSNMVSIG